MYLAGTTCCPVLRAIMPGQVRTTMESQPSIDCRGEKRKKGRRTWWDFELRGKLDRFIALGYATRDRVIRETFEMEDQYRWKRFDDSVYRDLLVQFSRTGRADPYGWGL